MWRIKIIDNVSIFEIKNEGSIYCLANTNGKGPFEGVIKPLTPIGLFFRVLKTSLSVAKNISKDVFFTINV